MDSEEALDSPEEELRTFAETVGEGFHLRTLRQARPGDGFSWGRYSAQADPRRHGDLPIFAYPRKKPGFLARLFGRG